jgi:hypothetical protein
MSKLVSHVHVNDKNGTSHAFGPDDELPEWAARQMGAHCFEDEEHPYPDDADGDGEPDREFGVEPPRNGKGSGRDAWASFSAEKGYTVTEGTPRDQIIADLLADEIIK